MTESSVPVFGHGSTRDDIAAEYVAEVSQAHNVAALQTESHCFFLTEDMLL